MSIVRRSGRHLARPIGGLLAFIAFGGAVTPTSAFGAPMAAKSKAGKNAPTTTSPAPAPKTFCDGWASVREVRNTGLTGITAMRMQSERYAVLVTLAPKEIRPEVEVMADYFATTLGIADKPINNQKQTDHLEVLIPKIGDALTAVTRYAVRTCPRSLVLSTTTTSTVVSGSTTTAVKAPNGAKATATAPAKKAAVK